MFLSIRSILALTMLLSAASSARADFFVRDVHADLTGDRVLVSARVDLSLSDEAERAVDNGVALDLVNEFVVLRDAAFWNETVSTFQTRTRLRYHALSNHYVVEHIGSEELETYRSITEALRNIGRLSQVSIKVPESPAGEYFVEIRTRLDINALPAPLRTMAMFSTDWRLASEWTRWRISP